MLLRGFISLLASLFHTTVHLLEFHTWQRRWIPLGYSINHSGTWSRTRPFRPRDRSLAQYSRRPRLGQRQEKRKRTERATASLPGSTPENRRSRKEKVGQSQGRGTKQPLSCSR